MQVFLLKAAHLSRSKNKNTDNSIKAYEVEVGVFDSVTKAEATICYSPYDDCCTKEFKGRDPATINSHIKEGDLAFQWCGDSIYPCIIASKPPSKEDWRRLKERVIRRTGRWHRSYGWDSSDDCYFVYEYDKGHAHPATWSVFPFFGTISKKNISRLAKTKEWYEAGCTEK